MTHMHDDEWCELSDKTCFAIDFDESDLDMCQPIGCDNGYHLPGCKYALVDANQYTEDDVRPDIP